MQMKKIKENAASLMGVVIAMGMFIYLTLAGVSGGTSIYLIVPLSALTGWFMGFLGSYRI